MQLAVAATARRALQGHCQRLTTDAGQGLCTHAASSGEPSVILMQAVRRAGASISTCMKHGSTKRLQGLLQLPRRAPGRPLQLEGGRHSSLTQFLPADSGAPKRKVMGLPVSGRTTFMAEGRQAHNGTDQYTPSLQ